MMRNTVIHASPMITIYSGLRGYDDTEQLATTAAVIESVARDRDGVTGDGHIYAARIADGTRRAAAIHCRYMHT